MSFKNISMTTIKEEISRAIPAKHMFFVVDACYSGLLITRAFEPRTETRSLAYLRDITGEEVRQVLAAGKATQEVLDGGPRGHSVFTGRFIEALDEATDFITATEISTRISEEVFSDAAARGHEQTPQGGKLFGLGDYVFVPKQVEVVAAEPVEAVAEPGGVSVDLQVWDRIEDSTDAADFETFIEIFPSSPMVGFARNKLKALTEVETALVAPAEPEPPGGTESRTLLESPTTALVPNRQEEPDRTETAALVIPPADRIEVDPLDEEYVTVRNANVRAGSTTESQRLTTLPAGTTVTVTGKVRGADWYRIENEVGGEGYVFASLLDEKIAVSELAFWESVRESDSLKDLEAYLERFPGGAFAGLARNRLEDLADLETGRPASPDPETARLVLPAGSPFEQYDYARALLIQKDYEGAERAFRAFVAAHPSDGLAGNAQYWLGETHYVRNEFEAAARVFVEGYQRFPESAKAPDFLLKLGTTLSALGQRAEACSTFEELALRFPLVSDNIGRGSAAESALLGCPPRTLGPDSEVAPSEPESESPDLAARVRSRMTISPIDVIRRQFRSCWSFPGGVRYPEGLIVTVRIHLEPDGSLSGEPQVVESERLGEPNFRTAAEAAVRAVHRCAPLQQLPPLDYNEWREIKLTFDPRDLVGGQGASLAGTRVGDLAPAQADIDVSALAEIEHWNRIEDYTDPGYFQLFLSRYPDGQYASLASSRLMEASAGAETTPVTPPEPEPQAEPVPGSDEDFHSVGDRVFFDYGSVNLRVSARRVLERQADWLNKYSNVSITIEGHADERGPREYSLAIAERRAMAAKDYLVSRGVDPGRVSIISYGKERPNTSGSNEAAWSQNRRGVSIIN